MVTTSLELRRLMCLLENANEGVMRETVDVRDILARYFRWDGEIVLDANDRVSIDGDCELLQSSSNLLALPVNFYKVTANFACDNAGLTSLDGCPEIVGGHFFAGNNALTDLHNAPKTIGGFCGVTGNELISLKGLPEAFGRISLTWNKDLPLLQLVGRNAVIYDNDNSNESGQKCHKILKSYIGRSTRADIIACQKDLIDAGFEGNASW